MGAFTTRDLWKAKRSKKTFISFQYIDGRDGRYVAEGSLIEVSEFLAGAIAKILIDSNFNPEELPSYLTSLSSRIEKIYKTHKK